MQMVFAIAVGGAIGAVARYYSAAAISKYTGAGFPLGTMSVNVIGSLLMGLLITLFAARFNGPSELKAFLTVGLLGSFTTFSTYSLETVLLIERGEWQSAGIYAIGSLVLGVMALLFGMWLGRLFV